MFITVEPGIYFNEPTLKKALNNPLQAQYINQHILKDFLNTGGCRIEDNIIITKNGCENLTQLPFTIQDIEQVMNEI